MSQYGPSGPHQAPSNIFENQRMINDSSVAHLRPHFRLVWAFALCSLWGPLPCAGGFCSLMGLLLAVGASARCGKECYIRQLFLFL